MSGILLLTVRYSRCPMQTDPSGWVTTRRLIGCSLVRLQLAILADELRSLVGDLPQLSAPLRQGPAIQQPA